MLHYIVQMSERLDIGMVLLDIHMLLRPQTVLCSVLHQEQVRETWCTACAWC